MSASDALEGHRGAPARRRPAPWEADRQARWVGLLRLAWRSKSEVAPRRPAPRTPAQTHPLPPGARAVRPPRTTPCLPRRSEGRSPDAAPTAGASVLPDASVPSLLLSYAGVRRTVSPLHQIGSSIIPDVGLVKSCAATCPSGTSWNRRSESDQCPLHIGWE